MKILLLLFLFVTVSGPVLGGNDYPSIKVKGVLDSPYTDPYSSPPDRVHSLDFLFKKEESKEAK